MSTRNRTQISELMSHIGELWDHLNTLFDDLDATDRWAGRHGTDWTFADVPYHLAYCNQDIIIRGLIAGEDMPQEEQELLANPEAVNTWNARKFAARPANQTADQSVAQWRVTCDRIRSMTDEMSDVDLDRPFWMPLFSGWATARTGLEFTRGHDWSEFMQLRIHMGRQDPVPSQAITKIYLEGILGFFPMFLNKQAATDHQFTVVMAFTDPGVGAFTIQVADGTAAVKEGEIPESDLIITQSAETFERTFRGILEPGEAIQSGLVQVNDFESLATFGELFPMP